MAKLTPTWSEDIYGKEVLRVDKKRGKITIEELENYLRLHRNLNGNWIIVLRCGEETLEGSGWGWGNEKEGDTVLLYEYTDACPICGKEIEDV